MLMLLFEQFEEYNHTLEGSECQCIIHLALLNLSLALMKNKLAALLGCLPEIIVTSQASPTPR